MPQQPGSGNTTSSTGQGSGPKFRYPSYDGSRSGPAPKAPAPTPSTPPSNSSGSSSSGSSSGTGRRITDYMLD